MSGSITHQTRKSPSIVGFDPQATPLLELPALPALPHEATQADFLRQAFSEPIGWQVDTLFKGSFFPDFLPHSLDIPAAVCIAFTPNPEGLGVLFTRRSAHLQNHAGQISFPGGRIEITDANSMAAAWRETHEEVGIKPEYLHYLGQHPVFVTSTGFAVRPVIAQLQAGFQLQADAGEVAEIFEVSLGRLMDPRNHYLHQIHMPDGRVREYFAIPCGEYFIWGATAVMLRNLYHHLAAAWRVLGQPDFQLQQP